MPNSTLVDRRRFLKRVIKSFFGFVGLVYIILTGLFVYPKKVRKKQTHFFRITSPENLPRRGVRMFFVEVKTPQRQFITRVFIVRSGQQLYALSPVCSHLGCLVNWNYNKKEFQCPCHGGRYDIQGRVLGGPPPKPLTRLPLRIEKDSVLVGLKV